MSVIFHPQCSESSSSGWTESKTKLMFSILSACPGRSPVRAGQIARRRAELVDHEHGDFHLARRRHVRGRNHARSEHRAGEKRQLRNDLEQIAVACDRRGADELKQRGAVVGRQSLETLFQQLQDMRYQWVFQFCLSLARRISASRPASAMMRIVFGNQGSGFCTTRLRSTKRGRKSELPFLRSLA